AFAGRGGRGGAGVFGNDSEPVGYAPTFYPGVPSVNEARPVTVSLGGEATDINFNILLVRTTRISGTVLNSDGSATWSGMVNVSPDSQASRAFGVSYGGRINYDGHFTVANVPPGRYVPRARST